jgi:RNA polymerase sigma-70 factor (ECF subfamily)
MERAIARNALAGLTVRESTFDDAALREQLESHHAESFGWAMSCCRHRREEAENVLQIVYVKVLSGRAIFDGRSAFKTWLFSVIRRTAVGERRSEMFRRLLLHEFFKRTPTSAPEGAEESVSAAQAQTTLRKALAKLPERQREVLHLVFYDDLTVQEAANVMGVGVGSARTHYERAKKQMRRHLESGARA